MIKKILSLLLFLSMQLAVAQQPQPVEPADQIYNTAAIEELPEFPGGIENFYTYVATNFNTPKQPGLKGKLIVTFVVEQDGALSDIKVIRDIGYGTGEEAIRVLNASPKWNPGKLNGQNVRVLYALPITIQSK